MEAVFWTIVTFAFVISALTVVLYAFARLSGYPRHDRPQH